MAVIDNLKSLEALYGVADATSTVKEIDWISPEYRRMIEASPFAVLATGGPEGLDCSPRGDRPGFVRVVGERTLVMPDRHGNNRIDSLRNIVREPRCALLFMIPGCGNTLRVNGSAVVEDDADLLRSFAVDRKAPRSVVVMTVEAIYFQCARAIVRSALWDPASHVARGDLPTPGEILAALSGGKVGGKPYDEAWPERARRTLW